MVFGTSPLMPGGAFEIPGSDPGWQTIPKHENQTVTVTYADESTADVTVKAGSFMRVYRQHDGRGYATEETVEIDFDNCSDDIKELEAPIASGETLYFEFTLLLTGAETRNVGVCVRTPPEPTGGFQVVSEGTFSVFEGDMFGADFFNNPAGKCRAGNEGELEGHSVIRVRGVVGNGPRPGLVKIQLGPADNEIAFELWEADLVGGQTRTGGVEPHEDTILVGVEAATLQSLNDWLVMATWGEDAPLEIVDSEGFEWGEPLIESGNYTVWVAQAGDLQEAFDVNFGVISGDFSVRVHSFRVDFNIDPESESEINQVIASDSAVGTTPLRVDSGIVGEVDQRLNLSSFLPRADSNYSDITGSYDPGVVSIGEEFSAVNLFGTYQIENPVNWTWDGGAEGFAYQIAFAIVQPT